MSKKNADVVDSSKVLVKTDKDKSALEGIDLNNYASK